MAKHYSKFTNDYTKIYYKGELLSAGLENYSRDQLKNVIELNGGKNLSSVSLKTNYLIAGDKMGLSKLKKAQDLGINIISEQDFNKLLNLNLDVF